MIGNLLTRSRAAFGTLLAIGFCFLGNLPREARAYTPESPEVQAMVERGVRYLEACQIPGDGSRDDSGVLLLMGLTLIKNGRDDSHPIVAAGVNRCHHLMRQDLSVGHSGIYWNSLALIFFCELNPVKYKAEAKFFLDLLLRLQQQRGAWGYPSSALGDTSQTQYGALGFWAANHAGLEVPTDNIERVCQWLLRTQDVGGGWAYQGNDTAGPRTTQTGITPSLAAAGAGSLYICGDLLGLHGVRENTVENDGLPPALKLVQEGEKAGGKKRRASKLDVGWLRRGEADANAWFAKNYVIKPMNWTYYYLYGLERYQSFRELAENKFEREPKWYNDGVELLMREQKSDGSWSGDHMDAVSTSFAVLFLIRSTKKMLGQAVVSEGALAGGRGLPTDVTNVKLKGNQVVGVSTTKSIDDLIDLLENPDDAALESAIADAVKLPLGSDSTTRAKQAERLRKIVSQSNFQARILAVKTLAQARDLDNVPVLIYALGDPDWRVAKEARDGLRLISRRFDGFDMPDRATTAQRAAAQQSWKQWYLSLRPEAEFLD